jgi:hypothetical protein
MSAPPHLCKDCRWFRPQEGGEPPLCGHPTSVAPDAINLVTGETVPGYPYKCGSLRSFVAFDDLCGREGRHWEPREIGFGVMDPP